MKIHYNQTKNYNVNNLLYNKYDYVLFNNFTSSIIKREI